MTFTSFKFAIFFPLVVLLYNLVPQKARLYLLLVASCIFYAFMQPVYLLLLALVACTTFFITKRIERVEEQNKRKLMILGLVLVLLPLFFFKYFNFINESVVNLLELAGITVTVPTIKWMLPVGISFYTFMAIGYIVDAYNEEVEVSHNLGEVGLFLSFFPIVLSGPIERAGNMLPQIKKLQKSTYDDLVSGLKLMLWGYFMKLCVADQLAGYMNVVYGNITSQSGATLAFASLLYPFQVYGDLGGYSLIAIGVARCMGIKIISNFNRPFFATSVAEFWRRWHMSLIQWLTDYIYTPLSFALRKWRIGGIVCALMLTFFISGIWHGAALTFIVWGLVQGVYMSVEAVLQKKRTVFEQKHNLTKKWWYIAICCVIVYVLFAFSQIFGSCDTVTDAFYVIKKMATDTGGIYIEKKHLLCVPLLFLKDFFDEFFHNRIRLFENPSIVVRWSSYIAVILIILFCGAFDVPSFIYFQF